MKRLLVTATATAILAAAAMQLPAGAASPIASYSMDESKTSTVLHDSSGNRLNGELGDEIIRKKNFLHFPKLPFHEPLDPAHIIKIPDPDGMFDIPATGAFSVTWKQRTTKNLRFRNVVQKGQGSPAGGMFKFRNIRDGKDSRIQCFWRGSKGGAITTSPAGKDYSDGKWHVVTCGRSNGPASRVYMTIDGRRVATDSNPGAIANTWPVSIGGNVAACETVGDDGRHCNYFFGDLAYMEFNK